MKKALVSILISLTLSLLHISCQQRAHLIVQRQISGPYVNSYLIHDPASREAALIDIGGPIDSLLATIDQNKLKIKYVLFTHGHIDHVLGWPALRDRFPETKVGIHRLDYDDMQTQLDWILRNLPPEEIAEWKSDPEVEKMFHFDAAHFGNPDIFLEDNQIIKLGGAEIRAIHAPGHSRGSICFHTGNDLFSGDVLMYRDVGRADFQNSSKEDLVRSVRRLYSLLPDSTVVHPGHGRRTDIGSEKAENPKVNLDACSL
ncbi:MAG TPA: MBL fold metallo-hydrolase [bacterium]|jgi:glyoxylase-like metal-dependent hydrolase (beta-lactamase superfamily II)